MNGQTAQPRDYGFLVGLLAGAVVGAGVALWLAPAAGADVRSRFKDSARRLGDDLRSKGDDMRDHVADAVARGAHDVEQFAVAVKSDRRSL
jgi:gas vesicle protein